MTQNILLVKLSSMGDIVHSFPALSDAMDHGHRFDWVVEEAFADLAAQHPAVDRVIPFGLRRWRKQLSTGLPALAGFVRELRARGYDQVLDAQGLMKSAFLARATGASVRMGLARQSARESIASLFYNRGVHVSWELHAIDRLRELFAQSLGYSVDLTQTVQTGLSDHAVPAAVETPATVLVHGTTWPSKELPAVVWRGVIDNLLTVGHRVVILSGSAKEYEFAQQLAGSQVNVAAREPGSLLSAFEQIKAAQLVIGVDSGLTHLAAVLGRPVVGLYGSTSEVRTGARGPAAINLASGFACAPCLRRECNYAGPPQLLAGSVVVPACYAELDPDRVVAAGVELLARASF